MAFIETGSLEELDKEAKLTPNDKMRSQIMTELARTPRGEMNGDDAFEQRLDNIEELLGDFRRTRMNLYQVPEDMARVIGALKRQLELLEETQRGSKMRILEELEKEVGKN